MAKTELTKLQGAIAVASFASGVGIAVTCLFIVSPPGEIANSAISIVSELLVLCGAILGVKASYDTKFRKFEAELRDIAAPERHSRLDRESPAAGHSDRHEESITA